MDVQVNPFHFHNSFPFGFPSILSRGWQVCNPYPGAVRVRLKKALPPVVFQKNRTKQRGFLPFFYIHEGKAPVLLNINKSSVNPRTDSTKMSVAFFVESVLYFECIFSVSRLLPG
jgi:hypothetical protein